MRKKPKRKLNKLALGGALIMSALFISLSWVSGYDQQNTHPALTDEAVDFYNLNFSANPLTQEDKEMLIKGAIEEDTPPRWFNHFYDPIYNQGWLGYTTSKKWAMDSGTQQAFSGFNYGGFANLFGDNLAPYDFSYERALHDYATGNRKRAMLAMGHVMHLLEDSNVPEHTRGDTHVAVHHSTGSPYEKTMAKWNPANLDIAAGLFKKSKKPVLLGSVDNYFDEIANYSNSYFFSEDTISSERYNLPKIIKIQQESLGDKILKFAIGLDKNKKEFKLALINTRTNRNVIEVKDATLINPIIGTAILDDYWSRLSTDFVVHGAGALKLFLDQAELVKSEYAERQSVSISYGWIGNLLSLFGFSGDKARIAFDPNLVESIISQSAVLGESVQDVGNDANRANNSANDVSIVPTLLALSPTPLARLATPSTTPSPTPIIYGGSNGGSSGSGSTVTSQPLPEATASEATPTPAPTPMPSVTPMPTLTPTPTHLPTISGSPTPTSSPPTPSPNSIPVRQIVINEIAWMGTGSTATLSNDEWLELYNPTSLPVDIGGWQLRSLTDNSPNITLASKTIDSFGFFLLERTKDDTISDTQADQIYTGNLNDIGEMLELRDNQGNLQDLVSKSNNGGWYAGDKASRSSMERINYLELGDNPSNWATNNGLIRNGRNAAGDFVNGTPRARNSVYVSQKPTTVNDLTVDPISFFGRIKLIWSAPKDDDTPVSQLKYDVRYATHSFDTITDWDIGAKVATSSMPIVVAPFASLQSSSFTIFDYNRTYHFAIKTSDGTSWSDISNQPKHSIKPAISDVLTTFRGPANPSISWHFELPTGFSVSQPGLAGDGTVYFGSSNYFQGKLYAINPNGTEKWRLDGFDNQAPSFPIVADDGVVYFGANGGLVYAVNPDMSIRWQSAGASGAIAKISLDRNGNIMFTDTANIPVNDRVFKIKPDGTAKWDVFLLTASGFTPITGPDGDAYTSSRLSANGIPSYYRLNGDNGAVVWQVSPNANSVYTTDNLAYDQAENKLYATGASGFRIFTINPSDGWLSEDIIKPFMANPTTKITISGDLLVVGATLVSNNPASGSAVYGIDKADKSVRWTFPISASTSGNPYNSIVNKEIVADVDGNFYFSTKGGKVYSIDRDGKERWMIDLGSNVNSTTDIYPVLSDGVIYVGATVGASGRLFKIAD